MRIAREEIFGPVLSVITFKDAEEAIKIANDTSYGLASSIYTNDLNVAHKMARALRAGTVSINCYSRATSRCRSAATRNWALAARTSR